MTDQRRYSKFDRPVSQIRKAIESWREERFMRSIIGKLFGKKVTATSSAVFLSKSLDTLEDRTVPVSM